MHGERFAERLEEGLDVSRVEKAVAVLVEGCERLANLRLGEVALAAPGRGRARVRARARALASRARTQAHRPDVVREAVGGVRVASPDVARVVVVRDVLRA